ncbi:hypothetical protein DXG01_015379 [Tephrocybe rancida]|nr:hypothetical protein DXG01_015379 [Tephrocybe rancida]
MSSATGHAVHLERPERSRNAKAQARHRAKRKAYIEQLEQTVTKLQTSLGLSHDDVSVLPPPLIRIRELEQENARLVKENDDLRRLLADTGRSTDGLRRSSLSTYPDVPRAHDRANDYKRKKYGGETEGGYMPAQMQEPLTSPVDHRPSPLTGNQNMSNYSSRTSHYGSVKVEEDSYVSHHGHYSLPPPTESYSHNNNNSNANATLLHDKNIALIGDTLDFETLGVHDLHGTTINPTSIVDMLDARGVFYHIWVAVKQTLAERNSRRIPGGSLVKASLERFLYEIADVILCRVDGPHFTFVDPRKHRDTGSIVRNAQRLIYLFEEKNIPKDKVVVSVRSFPLCVGWYHLRSKDRYQQRSKGCGLLRSLKACTESTPTFTWYPAFSTLRHVQKQQLQQLASQSAGWVHPKRALASRADRF